MPLSLVRLSFARTAAVARVVYVAAASCYVATDRKKTKVMRVFIGPVFLFVSVFVQQTGAHAR